MQAGAGGGLQRRGRAGATAARPPGAMRLCDLHQSAGWHISIERLRQPLNQTSAQSTQPSSWRAHARASRWSPDPRDMLGPAGVRCGVQPQQGALWARPDHPAACRRRAVGRQRPQGGWPGGGLVAYFGRWKQLAAWWNVTRDGAVAPIVAAGARSAAGCLLEIGACGLHQALRAHPKLLIAMHCWISACMIAGMESMHGVYILVPRHSFAASSQALALQ